MLALANVAGMDAGDGKNYNTASHEELLVLFFCFGTFKSVTGKASTGWNHLRVI